MMSDDMALVREYARSGSEQAFATLVSRYVNLVYSVALRQVRDPHVAEEVTQGVFIVLAKKAKSLGPKTIVSAWLCRTARFVSAHALRTQRRRQLREQEAYMESISSGADAGVWTEIEPMLDEGLGCLNAKEHDAVVLRFFEGKAFAEVGAAIGTTEDSARVRVSRAVEKLRRFFMKRGVTISAAALTGVVMANSVQAAPVGVAAAAAGVGTGAAVSTGLNVMVQSAMKTMTWLRMKFAIGVGATALLATSAVIAVASKSEAKHDFRDVIVILPGQSVGPVVKGMTTNEVEAVLGKPDKWVGKMMVYDQQYGMSVAQSEQGVVAVLCGDRKLNYPGVKKFKGRTKEGIGMRSTKEDLLRRLGGPTSYMNLPGDRPILRINYSQLGLTFDLESNQVFSIFMSFRNQNVPEPMLIKPTESVGKIKANMTTNEVEAILGKPDRWENTTMVYESRYGIYVTESDRGVILVYCGLRQSAPATAKQFTGQLKEGLKIGSTREEVIKALGKPYEEHPMRSGNWRGVDLNYRKLGIQFVLDSGKVSQMLVFLDKGLLP